MTRRQVRFFLALPFALSFATILLTATQCCTYAPAARYEATLGETKLPLRFVIFGDTRRTFAIEFWRRQNDEERTRVMKRIVEESPTFILNTGDLVNDASSRSAWEYFDREHAFVRERNIPYYPILGNHEYWGPTVEARRNVFVRFPFLNNRTWYDLRVPPVLFLMLDSNFADLTPDERKAQNVWLEEQLRAAQEDPGVAAVFLLFHHPPYTNSKTHGPSGETQEHFVAPGKRFPKVKALFCGHVHSYERFFEEGLHVVISGGGGAPLHEIETDPKKRKYRDYYEGPALRRFNYCACTLTEKRLEVEMFELDEQNAWQSRDRFFIDLPPAK